MPAQDRTASLDDELRALTLGVTGASAIAGSQVVQRLWGGYGRILRCDLGV